MARRQTKPASIDAAPVSVPVVVVQHTGLNREQRRWAEVKHDTGWCRVFRKNWRSLPVTNEPHRVLMQPLGQTGAVVRMPASRVAQLDLQRALYGGR